MKKTKLLTSIAALALVLSLGACTEPVEDDVSSEDNEPTSSETTTTEDNTSENTPEDNTSEDSSDDETSGGEGGGEENDPVANMLADIGENNNFTITIEYYEWYSGYYEDYDQMINDYYDGSMVTYGNDMFIVLTFTEDAVLMEYYTSYIEYLLGYVYDVELYVNDEDGLKVYYVDWTKEPTDYTSLVFDHADETSATWQDLFWTPVDLVDYSDHFVKGETSEGGRYGTTIDYSVTGLNDSSFVGLLSNCMFDCGNWFAASGYSWFLYYYAYYMFQGLTPNASSTYYVDYDEWDLELYFFPYFTYVSEDSSTGYEYVLELDSASAAIESVGTSVIPEDYASYLD